VRAWAVLVVALCACPSKSIDRRSDESLKEDVQWSQSQRVESEKRVAQQVNKHRQTTRRTPVVTSAGQAVVTPKGDPVFVVEEINESSDTSTSIKTDLRGDSSTDGAASIDRSKSNRETLKTDWHAWKLRIIAVAILAVLLSIVYLAVKRSWIFGWIFDNRKK
jgi:cobalamin biosynthesis Mg chelatase CobN